MIHQDEKEVSRKIKSNRRKDSKRIKSYLRLKHVIGIALLWALHIPSRTLKRIKKDQYTIPKYYKNIQTLRKISVPAKDTDQEWASILDV